MFLKNKKRTCLILGALALSMCAVVPVSAADGDPQNAYEDAEPSYQVKDLGLETNVNHESPRIVQKLNGSQEDGGWQFKCGSGNSGILADDSGVVDVSYDDASWETVYLPHTWNADEAHDGQKNNLNKTVGWYRRTFDVNLDEFAGKRVYMEFEGANQKTALWINGKQVELCQEDDALNMTGEKYVHLGGYTQFRYDITDYLKDGENLAAVKVDNRLDERIIPLSADFNFYGGIYRDVYLTAVDEVHVDMSAYGSSGLYLATPNGGLQTIERPDNLGQMDIRSQIVNESSEEKKVTVSAVITGDNAPSALTQEFTIPAGGSVSFDKSALIENPHLWQGISYAKDADNTDVGYQYEVELTVQAENGDVLDKVSDKVGYRWFYVDKEKGFYLNGESHPLRGVNRHQEEEGYGNAISNAQHYADLQEMMDMGVNTVRACHYPQASYFYDLCDANGVIVWAEIPLVNRMGTDEKFDEVTKVMLQELINQQYNHPSIAMWGLENEVGNAGGTSNNYLNMKQLMNELHLLAKEEDSSRLTVQAVNQYVTMNNNQMNYNYGDYSNNQGWNSDVVCWNIYPGWYNNFSGNFEECMDSYLPLDSRPMGISEYGWGSNIEQHELYPVHLKNDLTPYGSWHPEEYQNLMHEEALAYIDPENNPQIWGTWLWVMFDFNVDAREEGGQKELNDKGLVTADRETRKDSFYLYKANWNQQDPFAYISSRRYTEKEEAPGYIKVYSNCDAVTAQIIKDNGQPQTLELTNKGHGVFTAENVMNEAGTYKVSVTAVRDGDEKKYTDEVTWVKKAGAKAELTSDVYPVDNEEGTVTLSEPVSYEEIRANLFGVNGATYQIYDGTEEVTEEQAEVRPGMTIKVVSEDKSVTKNFSFTAANLASGKTVTASSYQTGNIPENAVDSNGDTRWVASDASFPQWITIDLGAPYFLSSIDIDWYADGGRYYRYTVSSSLDGKNYTVIADRSDNTASGEVKDRLHQTKARYVRIDVTGASAGWAALYEVKINGWSMETAENSDYQIDHANRLIILPVDEVGTDITTQDVLDNLVISGNCTYRNDIPTGYVNDGNHIFIKDVDGTEFPYTLTGRNTASEKLVNLALGRPVSFSSEEGTSTSGTDTHGYNLTDGDVTTNWAAATKNGQANYPEWIAADLGEVCDISAIETYFYKPQSRIYQYKLWGSLDGQEYTLLQDCSDNKEKPGEGGNYIFTAEPETKARYIKVEVTGNSEFATNKLAVANLYELAVYGRKEVQDLSIKEITLDQKELIMDVGGTYELKAYLTPADTTDTEILWESSNTEAATVSDSGVIEAKRSGKAVITASSKANPQVSASCTVTVRKDAVVSVGKDTFCSSEEGLSATGGGMSLAEYINDGDLTTRWTADTNGSTLSKYPEWVAVDLGAVYDVSELELYFYKYGEDSRSYAYEVYVSTDTVPENGQDFYRFSDGYERIIDAASNTDKSGHFDHILGETHEARYVLLKVNSCSDTSHPAIAASVYEMSVYGAEKAEEEPAPSKPDNQTVEMLLANNAVGVECQNAEQNHEAKTYGITEGYETGDVYGNREDGYKADIRITADAYVGQYNSDTGEVHTLAAGENGARSITLVYEDGAWKLSGDYQTTVFKVICDPQAGPGTDVDKTKLKELIDKANALTEDNYSKYSYDKLTEVLAEAEKVYEDSEADEQEIAAQADALAGKLDALVSIQTLNEEIGKADALSPEHYDASSYERFQEELLAVKEVQTKAKSGTEVSQEEIDEAVTRLTDAYSLLTGVKKDALQEKYDELSSIDRSKYTEQSLALLDEALAYAESVLNNPDAVQSQIDEAFQKLSTVKLEKKPDAGAVTPQKPGGYGTAGGSGTTGGAKPEENKAVQTGDSSLDGAGFLLLALALSGATAVYVMRRKVRG